MTISHFSAAGLPRSGLRACLFAILTATAGQTMAQDLVVPSGQSLTFLEFISENEGDLVRFRFLAPAIAAELTYMDVFGDFQVVCDEQIMPVLDANGLTPTQIVLSMSAQDIPFGEDNADVLQFFEIFSPKNGLCIWEEF